MDSANAYFTFGGGGPDSRYGNTSFYDFSTTPYSISGQQLMLTAFRIKKDQSQSYSEDAKKIAVPLSSLSFQLKV